MLFRSASDIVKRRGHPPHFFRQLLAHTTVADSGPQWGAPEARPDDIRSNVR